MKARAGKAERRGPALTRRQLFGGTAGLALLSALLRGRRSRSGREPRKGEPERPLWIGHF